MEIVLVAIGLVVVFVLGCALMALAFGMLIR